MRSVAWRCVVAGVAAVLGGCGGRGPVPGAEPYAGPALSIDTTRATYTIVLEAPTPGWTMETVATRQLFERREVYVLLRRPNPVYLYPQVVVTQHLGTDVRTDMPMDLYAAVAAHDAARGPEVFGRAASSEGTPPVEARDAAGVE